LSKLKTKLPQKLSTNPENSLRIVPWIIGHAIIGQLYSKIS